MVYQQLLYKLKEALQAQLPLDANLAKELSTVLGITTRSANSKLKGEIQFSVQDLLKITDSFRITLGSLIDDYSYVFSHPMELILIRNMSKEEGYKFSLETTRNIFERAGRSGNSKFTAVCKNLPVISYHYYEWLMKFAHLKWTYFNNGLSEKISLSDIHSSFWHPQAKNIYVESFNTIRRLVFIMDGDIIRNYLKDLDFFRKIGHLTASEMHFILDDLEHLLATVEDICKKGYSPASGQQIQVFYSDIALHNDIYLVESTHLNTGIIYAQGFTPIIHKQPETFYTLRRWADSWLRYSNPICGTEELNQRAFFKKQNHMVKEYRNQSGWVDFS